MTNKFDMDNENDMKINMLKKKFYDTILNNAPITTDYMWNLMLKAIHKLLDDLKINKLSY